MTCDNPTRAKTMKRTLKPARSPRTPTPVTLRRMQEDDLTLLHAWLQRPHIVRWWGSNDGSLSRDEIQARYLPSKDAGVRQYIALLGARAIGWAQSYVALGAGDGWWEEETDPGVRGIDQFLGDPNDLGHGLGTRMVTALVTLLFLDTAVTRIQTDPSPDNVRAIRCYEKAGFRAIKRIVTPAGAAILMTQVRPGNETCGRRRTAREPDRRRHSKGR